MVFNWAIFLLQGTTVWGQYGGKVLMALNRQRSPTSTKHNLHSSKEPPRSNIPKCRSLETQLPRYEGIWCHFSRVQLCENDFVLPTSKMASDQSWTAPARWFGPGSHPRASEPMEGAQLWDEPLDRAGAGGQS